MARAFKKGDILTFHGTIKSKRYTKVIGKAEENGQTGVAWTYKVRIKPGVVRVPGNQIYIIESK